MSSKVNQFDARMNAAKEISCVGDLVREASDSEEILEAIERLEVITASLRIVRP